MGKLYTCGEIAERYGVKTSTVWTWVRQGRLEAIKLPKGRRVTEEQLRRFEGSAEKEDA